MDARLEGLATLLKQKAEKIADEAKFKSYIDGNKVVVKVTKKGVDASVVERKDQPKKRVSTLTDAEKAEIKEAKKLLKNNQDLQNLVVLLIRVKEEARKINFKKLPSEQIEMVRRIVTEVQDAGLFQKALEDRR